MKIISFLFIAGTLAAQERRIDAGLLTTVVNGILGGTQVHLNTYGPRHGDSWYVADSWMQLPPALAAMRVPLTITETRGGPESAFRIYLNDINLRNLSVAIEDQYVHTFGSASLLKKMGRKRVPSAETTFSADLLATRPRRFIGPSGCSAPAGGRGGTHHLSRSYRTDHGRC